jgi:transcriptional repressor of dcmA and dcmR
MSATDKTVEPLLNIKQAAEILNASEISLRRWTDSGKLPCLRIGTRRERRFRLSDLQDYLEQNQTLAQDAAIKQTSKRIAKIELEGISIDYGSHLCTFYDTDPGRLKLSLPFLRDGLLAGERCFLVATAEIQVSILNELRDVRPTIDQDIHEGRLITSDGMTSGAELYAFFENAFLNAGKQGIKGLRVLGDMAWALEKGLSIETLYDFEANYNQGLGRRFPVVSLCQYDARLFSGIALLNALKCHEDTFQYPLNHFLGV